MACPFLPGLRKAFCLVACRALPGIFPISARMQKPMRSSAVDFPEQPDEVADVVEIIFFRHLLDDEAFFQQFRYRVVKAVLQFIFREWRVDDGGELFPEITLAHIAGVGGFPCANAPCCGSQQGECRNQGGIMAASLFLQDAVRKGGEEIHEKAGYGVPGMQVIRFQVCPVKMFPVVAVQVHGVFHQIQKMVPEKSLNASHAYFHSPVFTNDAMPDVGRERQKRFEFCRVPEHGFEKSFRMQNAHEMDGVVVFIKASVRFPWRGQDAGYPVEIQFGYADSHPVSSSQQNVHVNRLMEIHIVFRPFVGALAADLRDAHSTWKDGS